MLAAAATSSCLIPINFKIYDSPSSREIIVEEGVPSVH